MKKLLTIAVLSCLFAACSSDESPESNINMLATGKWNLSGIFINLTDENGTTTNVNVFDLAICPDCLKDDQMEISGNGQYEISLGEDLCENNVQIFKFPHKGTWCFTQSEDSIILNPSEPDSIIMCIKALTETELMLSYTDTIPQLLLLNDTLVQEIGILYKHNSSKNQNLLQLH